MTVKHKYDTIQLIFEKYFTTSLITDVIFRLGVTSEQSYLKIQVRLGIWMVCDRQVQACTTGGPYALTSNGEKVEDGVMARGI